jgi:molybdopterin/thiamine biosynthesis adenylyltransferase
MHQETITKELYFERLLAALGKVSLKKIHEQKVVIINLQAVGTEVLKNMTLITPSLITIIDEAKITEEDFNYNFFINRNDMGKRRSTVMKEKMAEMNPFVKITEGTYADLNPDFIKGYDLVISTDRPDRQEMQAWNSICRNCRRSGVAFMATGCIGFFCWLFIDLGEIKIYDRMFHNKVSHFYIDNITKGSPGVVELSKVRSHYFQSGDFVSIECKFYSQ